MYKSFYNLKSKPFQISTDPKFLWLGEKHREALATLKYGVLDNKGFLLITGDVGTGKTTLINALINSFGNNVIYATIPDPGLENLDFFRYIAHVFKFEKDFKSKGDFLIHFGRFLIDAYQRKKTVVLIIDEAQLLTHEILEQIRLLSNIEKQHRKLINIFFVGQNEFNEILLKHENRALCQRITINYHIEPLRRSETGEYIQYRLQKAGGSARIFRNGAIKQIYAFSKGYPRLINIICDHAMLTGYVKEARAIDAKIVKECVKELKISQQASSRQGQNVKSRPAGASRPPAPEKQSRRKRSLSYLILLVLLVIVTSLMLKMQNSTEGLTTTLRKLETLITTRDRPMPTAIKKDAGTGPVVIKIKPAAVNTPVQNTGGEAQQSPQSGSADTRTGEQGAPEPAIDPIAKAREFIARTGGRLTIFFSYNSTEISKSEFDGLNEFADIAARTPDTKIIVTGHSDTAGSIKNNHKLSKLRANIVKSYFVGKGVKPENIISTGRRPENPLIQSSKGIKSRADRRVVVEMKVGSI
jgi:general secretion pathway protein A